MLFLLEEPTINKFTILFQETLTFMALLEPSQYRQESMVEMELDLTVSLTNENKVVLVLDQFLNKNSDLKVLLLRENQSELLLLTSSFKHLMELK